MAHLAKVARSNAGALAFIQSGGVVSDDSACLYRIIGRLLCRTQCFVRQLLYMLDCRRYPDIAL